MRRNGCLAVIGDVDSRRAARGLPCSSEPFVISSTGGASTGSYSEEGGSWLAAIGCRALLAAGASFGPTRPAASTSTSTQSG